MRKDIKLILLTLVFTIFFILRQEARLVLPPTTQKKFQEWKKLKVLIYYPKRVDLNNDGVVNFKDFAILADHWLEKSK